MNIYKLLTFIFILNIILGSAMTLGTYTNDNTIYQDELTKIDNQFDTQEGAEETIIEDESETTTSELQLTTGSGIKWSKVIKDILIKSVNPISVNPTLFDDGFEKAIAYLLSAFRILIGTFFVVKLYDKIKNKEGS